MTSLSKPIPVVVPLAAWAKTRGPLDDWLVQTLIELYDVKQPWARRWLDNGMLLPMLDSLDEVPRPAQERCLVRLEEFRTRYRDLVVTTRADDYERLRGRPGFSGAVTIRPLSEALVDKYLEEAGESLAGLRGQLIEDPELRELLRTPLWLSVAAVAYKGLSPSEIRLSQGTGTLDGRRAHLFDCFIQATFSRRAKSLPFSSRKTCRWLQWLGVAMHLHLDQPIFHLEQLNPSWLPVSRQRQSVIDRMVRYLPVWVVWGLVVPLPIVYLLDWPFGLIAWLAIVSISAAVGARLAIDEAAGAFKPGSKPQATHSNVS
jgi:hypothetical protein